MNKILLHIGTEKTGTKAIQQYLAENQTRLMHRHQVLYPKEPALFWNDAHFPIAASLLPPEQCDFVPMTKRIGADEVFYALKKQIDAARPHLTILSCEHFSSRFKSDEINRLADALAGYEVRILVYLRPQDEMALSSFSTALTQGRRSWFKAAQIHPEDSYYNFSTMLDSWASAFSDESIIVRAFQKQALVAGDVVADFLAVSGIDKNPDFSMSRHLNQSLSVKAARFLHALNQQLVDWEQAVEKEDYGGYEQDQLLRNILLEVTRQQGCFADSVPLHAIISDEEKKALMKEFKRTNDAVAHRFLGKHELFADFPKVTDPGRHSMSPGFATADWVRVVLSCASRILELERQTEDLRAQLSK